MIFVYHLQAGNDRCTLATRLRPHALGQQARVRSTMGSGPLASHVDGPVDPGSEVCSSFELCVLSVLTVAWCQGGMPSSEMPRKTDGSVDPVAIAGSSGGAPIGRHEHELGLNASCGSEPSLVGSVRGPSTWIFFFKHEFKKTC